MRFLVDIDGDWKVTVTAPSKGVAWRRSRQMRRLASGAAGNFPAPPPEELPAPTADHYELCTGADTGRLVDAYTKIATRHPLAPVTEFGRYLFDSLLGEPLWRDIRAATAEEGAGVIELALCWPAAERELHRLNWEMMRSADRFLATGAGNASVAITRLVADAGALARQLDAPPRVLFVIGTSLTDPRIRPGAEYLGLVRQLKRSGRTIHGRLLENATPRRMREVMARFRPDIVYFVCHGNIDPLDGRGYLEFATDEHERDADARRYAEQLLEHLEVDGGFPAMVVLSTCFSAATATGAVTSRMLGAHETAPLAAELVQGGVPIVLGMAGRVSDLACRLFTRRFGESLVAGLSLVAATADARRATFAEANPPHQSLDWALPAVFMAAAVDPDYTPVHPRDDDPADRIAKLVTAYNVEREPVFCGRDDFFQAYYELFEGQGKGVLAAFVRESSPGFGRTRLLQELTIQAIRDGNIPVFVNTPSGRQPPRTPAQFGAQLLDAIMAVRTMLGLDLPLDSQLDLLGQWSPHGADERGLDKFVKFELRTKQEVTAKAVRRALQLDLDALTEDARGHVDLIGQAGGRVVILLDEVDKYDEGVVALFDEMLDGFGLGSMEWPAPVVLTFSLGGTMDHFLRPIVERGVALPWLDLRELTVFQDDGEDMMAYELVLLNPFSSTLAPGFSDRSWGLNPEVSDDVRALWASRFRRNLAGMPKNLADPRLYLLVQWALDSAFFVEADDELRLAKLRGDR